MISIFADGSSSGARGGAGGYGWCITKGDEVLAWGYGGSPWTTNNLQELEGCIQGLEALLHLELHLVGEPIELVSDSQYALGMASGEYNPTTNLEQVEKLLSLVQKAKPRLRWVRGHVGNKYNEVCDTLAKQGKMENMTAEELRKYESKRRRVTKRHDRTQHPSLAAPRPEEEGPPG